MSCFQSNLLKCCQQICPYPADIIWFSLKLTLPSYREMISFSISISLIIPYHMSRRICVQFFKVFSRSTVLCLHVSSFWHWTDVQNAKQMFQGFACYIYMDTEEWETYFIARPELLSKIYSMDFSQDLFQWITEMWLKMKCGICVKIFR